MPAPGDQHTSAVTPFAEPPPRISEYTTQEIATLQSRLEKHLGPEYISSRAGPANSRVHFLAADKCIALANEVFGFNGWSSSIQNIQVDFVDEDEKTKKISVGLSVIVRVTLRDGTYHEDIGYGQSENCKGKAAALEKAKKEGTTDALKRALRQFGNVLGNCLYDKAYLAKVTKMRVAPTKLDESCLHRHPDYVVKREPAERESAKEQTGAQHPAPSPQLPTADSFEDLLGELDEVDFNISDEGHPDEVILPNSNETDTNQFNVSHRGLNQQTSSIANHSMHPPARQLSRAGSASSNPPRQAPQTPVQQAQRASTNNFPGAQNGGPPAALQAPQQFNPNRPPPKPNNLNPNQKPPAQLTPPQAAGNENEMVPAGGTVGFFSAKAVKHLPEETLASGTIAPKAGQVFNPRLESPSIRRTPGVDHSSSKPVSKSGQHVPPRTRTEEPENAADGSNTGQQITAATGGKQQQQPQQQRHLAPVGAGATAGRSVSAVPPPARPANVVNPQLDQTRRIGAPGAASPSANRGHGQFRPPVKRSAGGDAPGLNGNPGPGTAVGTVVGVGGAGARVPLGDVSNNAVVAVVGGGGNGGGPEMKRQRTS